MARMARTWWGEKFLDVLSTCMDSGRLSRGRAYAGPHRLLEMEIEHDTVRAVMRGRVNPYFGVYKEPRYRVSVQLKRFSAQEWSSIAEAISLNAAFLSYLLMNEMPPTIEKVFHTQNLHLLPRERGDLIAACSCPDYAVPCKHIAGIYYKIASLLDRDPLLLFQLRGMTFEELRKKLAASPLGQALIDQRRDGEMVIEYQSHRYTDPPRTPLAPTSLKSFWHGSASLPSVNSVGNRAFTPAVLIKKGGDYPSFWTRDKSFIEVMEPIYARVITKNKSSL